LCAVWQICNRCSRFVAMITARTRNVSECLYSLYAWYLHYLQNEATHRWRLNTAAMVLLSELNIVCFSRLFRMRSQCQNRGPIQTSAKILRCTLIAERMLIRWQITLLMCRVYYQQHCAHGKRRYLTYSGRCIVPRWQ